MTYVPRRLRKPTGPRWALITRERITREQAADLKRSWAQAQRKTAPVVIDGTMLTLQRLR